MHNNIFIFKKCFINIYKLHITIFIDIKNDTVNYANCGPITLMFLMSLK